MVEIGWANRDKSELQLLHVSRNRVRLYRHWPNAKLIKYGSKKTKKLRDKVRTMILNYTTGEFIVNGKLLLTVPVCKDCIPTLRFSGTIFIGSKLELDRIV